MKNKALIEAFSRGVEYGKKAYFPTKVRIMQQQYIDRTLLTLGEMGMSPDFLAEFEDRFSVVTDTYNDEWLNDTEDLDYVTFEIDRSLAQYVRPDRFVPARERYALKNEHGTSPEEIQNEIN